MDLDFLHNIAGLDSIDAHFGVFAAQSMTGPAAANVAVAAALAHHAVSLGDVCCDLNDFAQKPLLNAQNETVFTCPDYAAWVKELLASGVMGKPGGEYPLIMDEAGYVYLYQYYRYQIQIAAFILGRNRLKLNTNLYEVAEIIKRLFKKYTPALNLNNADQRQMLAALNAAVNPFCVISGGPGTGKTTTIARILALLLELKLVRPGRIMLAAPTGKAAARLGEAVRNAINDLATAKTVIDAIPQQAYTIHRLLAQIAEINVPKAFNAQFKLPADVVVVDEASMADIILLNRLMESLPPNGRLILAGDHAQLAAVGAGSVLSDICGGITGDIAFSPGYSNLLQTVYKGNYTEVAALPPQIELRQPGDSIVFLTKNYRFKDSAGGLSKLTPLIRTGKADEALELLKDPMEPAVNINGQVAVSQIVKALKPFVTRFYLPMVKAGTKEEALQYFETFRILCALRESFLGAQNLNKACEYILREAGAIGEDDYYHGMPVIIGTNDYRLKLYNGDTGIVWRHDDGTLRAYFRDYQEGELKSFAYYSLPAHEKAYAMTVHRSQGSEFDDVLLVLPDKDNRILTRELVYTGVSRAKTNMTVWSSEKVFAAAVKRLMERKSGLTNSLAKAAEETKIV